MDLEALPDVTLVEVPLLPMIFIGTSTVKRSEEMLGWCTSMAAVVITQIAASGTPLSVMQAITDTQGYKSLSAFFGMTTEF